MTILSSLVKNLSSVESQWEPNKYGKKTSKCIKFNVLINSFDDDIIIEFQINIIEKNYIELIK